MLTTTQVDIPFSDTDPMAHEELKAAEPTTEPSFSRDVGRWSIYFLIIMAASLSGVLRIQQVNVYDSATRKLKESVGSPLLCANDRSRWCTIRALGDENQYEIDYIIADLDTGRFSFDRREYNRFWATIDLVKHLDRSGEMRFYSSKPTLFPTMLAWLYRGIRFATGKTLADDTFFVVRLMLVLVNVVPMALFLFLLAIILETIARKSFTRYVVLTVASFGTFLTPFVVTLNNHLPAAFSVGITLFAMVQILKRKDEFAGHYFIAGLFSAFAAANELPALSFFCFVGFILLLCNWWRTLLLFVPGAAIVVAAFFWTNRIAHDDWIPPYAHRSDGKVVTTIDADLFEQVTAGKVTPRLIEVLDEHEQVIGFPVSERSANIKPGQMPLDEGTLERYVLTHVDESQRLAIVKRDTGEYQIRLWNNWYEYPESRWLLGKKAGVDKGEADPATYAFHCLIGHHGIFSLTPFWLLTAIGFGFAFHGRMKKYSWVSVMIIIVSVVVVSFYLSRPLEDRNYGGGTSALRWLLWLAPLWLFSAVPAVDWLARNIWGKITVACLALVSIASAHYSAFNPWVHPWLYELLVTLKWIDPF